MGGGVADDSLLSSSVEDLRPGGGGEGFAAASMAWVRMTGSSLRGGCRFPGGGSAEGFIDGDVDARPWGRDAGSVDAGWGWRAGAAGAGER